MSNKFFEERSDQSEVKARIVQKYFTAWANVIKGAAKRLGRNIAYVDLYAGPGRYKDGAASTPLMVLQSIIDSPDLRDMTVTLFNDQDADRSQTLAEEVAALPGIDKLRFKPQILNLAVDASAEEYFSKVRMDPTFSFFDPFGYKGLSLGVIKAFIKDWGCDCIFFFNYNRINAGVNNEAVTQHIDALFSPERAAKLRHVLSTLSPAKREMMILEEIALAISDMGGKHVLPFKFKNENGRTSHYLVFVSKHVKGYEIMKEIMASESSTTDQGVPSFVYSPADAMFPLLFSLARPLDALEGLLLERFASQTLPMKEVYTRHHVDTPYIKRNYRDALRSLEAQGRISVAPCADERPKQKGQVTFAEHVMISFPAAKGQ